MINYDRGYKIELTKEGLFIYATDYHASPVILNDEELKELGLMRIPKDQKTEKESNG